MRKSRFTETQIVSILKSVDAGKKVKDICREEGISDATYYKWKSKYGGMEASGSEARQGARVGTRAVQADVCGAGARE